MIKAYCFKNGSLTVFGRTFSDMRLLEASASGSLKFASPEANVIIVPAARRVYFSGVGVAEACWFVKRDNSVWVEYPDVEDIDQASTVAPDVW